MQVVFFLLPKGDTIYLTQNQTLRQGLEKMQHHRYSAVPLLDDDGHYIGSLTVADFLWYIKDAFNMNLENASKVLLKDIPRQHDNPPVSINAKISDLLQMAIEENFIPVVDDLGIFIGIVRRKEILEYYQNREDKSFLPGNNE